MPQDNTPLRIEISYKTVIFTVSVLIGLWFLIQIRQILVFVFFSIILLSALLKPVEWLNVRRIPRVLSILFVYIILIAVISFIVGIIIPPLISQTSDFISKLPQIISKINDFLVFYQIPVQNLSDILTRQIQAVIGNLISISTAIFSSIFLLITIFVFTFYLLLEHKSAIKFIASPFSGKQEKKVSSAISFIVGILIFIGLTILQIPFALPLALVAGLLEIVPIVGPIVSSIPAILVGLTISPLIGLAIAALFFIVQQLENHLIVPVVMSKAVGLQPPVVILALLIGAKLAGIGGAVLAVPTVVVARIIFREFLEEDQKFEDGLKEQ